MNEHGAVVLDRQPGEKREAAGKGKCALEYLLWTAAVLSLLRVASGPLVVGRVTPDT